METSSRFDASFARPSLLCALLLGCASLSAMAADDTFVKKASAGGATEVAAGKLATTQGSSDKVRQFGAMMVTDHTKAGDELKTIADSKKMNPRTVPDSAGQKAVGKLRAKSGAAFDTAFKTQMVKDHKDTIALFQKEADSGSDADLKAFAAKTLPDLKHHLEMAQAL